MNTTTAPTPNPARLVPADPYVCNMPQFDGGEFVGHCTGEVTARIEVGTVLLPTYCNGCHAAAQARLG